MSENNKQKSILIKTYMDYSASCSENEIKDILRSRFERNLDDGMVLRYKELLPIHIHWYDGRYATFLQEARELYIEGKFYSCVAMCGITAERIAKDLLQTNLLIKGEPPSNEQMAIIDKIEMSNILKLLEKSEIIEKEIQKSFIKLLELRNHYAHGAGQNHQKDSENAIKYLHKIVEGTVSIFKNYELQNDHP